MTNKFKIGDIVITNDEKFIGKIETIVETKTGYEYSIKSFYKEVRAKEIILTKLIKEII